MFCRISFVVIILLGSALAPGASSSVIAASRTGNRAVADPAEALVRESARAVQTIDRFEVSHQVDVTRVTPRYNETTHAYLKTWIQRPGRIRVEIQQYMHSETIVSDGTTTWIYDGTTRTYRKQSEGAPAALFANAFPGLARMLSSTNLPSEMIAAKLVGTEALTIAGRTYQCSIVDVSVLPSASNRHLQGDTLRLWISSTYKVPLKVEATFVGETAADRRRYSDFVTNFEPNLKIPTSTWRFTPPKDAKERTGAGK